MARSQVRPFGSNASCDAGNFTNHSTRKCLRNDSGTFWVPLVHKLNQCLNPRHRKTMTQKN